ncbi:MAG: hypothetical protein U0T82_08225 [Bacteroidales bacterium]
MFKTCCLSGCILLIFSCNTGAQSDSALLLKPDVSGYFSEVGSVIHWKAYNPVWDNILQNRIRFSWTPVHWIDMEVQARTRFLYGETVRNTPGYAASLDADRGIADLSRNLAEGNTFLINSQIDRMALHFTGGPLEITLGRQRINWGQTFVWNPNDIFNAYSFFEFDYPEKPGSDAVRLQYFSGIANRLELAVKSDSGGRITAAGMAHLNWRNYDFQFLAGELDGEDLFAGIGWAGSIFSAGFKGEASYFHPLENARDTSGLMLVSISADYSFANSWHLLGELLLRYQDNSNSVVNITDYLNSPASVKKLAIADVNLLTQLSIPIHSLLNGSLAIMAIPGVKGMFASPSLSLSLSNNLEASISAQYFHGRFPDPVTSLESAQTLGIGYFRLKWDF